MLIGIFNNVYVPLSYPLLNTSKYKILDFLTTLTFVKLSVPIPELEILALSECTRTIFTLWKHPTCSFHIWFIKISIKFEPAPSAPASELKIISANLYHPTPSLPMEKSVYTLMPADGFNALISFLVATLFKLPFK